VIWRDPVREIFHLALGAWRPGPPRPIVHQESGEERPELAQASEATSREAIDAEEACWPIPRLDKTRLDKTEGFSTAERQRLAWIKANSLAIDPVIDPALRAGWNRDTAKQESAGPISGAGPPSTGS